MMLLFISSILHLPFFHEVTSYHEPASPCKVLLLICPHKFCIVRHIYRYTPFHKTMANCKLLWWIYKINIFLPYESPFICAPSRRIKGSSFKIHLCNWFLEEPLSNCHKSLQVRWSGNVHRRLISIQIILLKFFNIFSLSSQLLYEHGTDS